jgi:hypothetical protein
LELVGRRGEAFRVEEAVLAGEVCLAAWAAPLALDLVSTLEELLMVDAHYVVRGRARQMP